MRPAPRLLLNTPDIELWPGGLLRARSNADARILSRASMVLRRKRDGRYLAALLPEGMQPLLPHWTREAGVEAALDALDALNATGKTIGVISHVEAMKERIPVQIKVKKINGLGYSRLDREFAVQ